MELKGKKINFLGDSITEGAGASCEEKKYVGVIAKEHGAIVRNYGISGTRIAVQATPSEEPRFDLDFQRRAKEMDTDADFVVIFGGTNDYGHGDAPLGVMTDRCDNTFYGSLHLLFSDIRARFTDSKIAVLTPLHRLGEDEPTAEGKAVLKTYVEAVREVAEYYSLPVLDLFKVSGLQPAIPVIQQKFMPDGLHPSDAGHKILADLISNFLKTL